MRKIKSKIKSAMERCSRFTRCDVPLCPLDPDMNKRTYLEGEPICTFPKSIRKRLGKDLPNMGLFPRELSGLRNWEAKSDEEKAKIREDGKKRLQTYRKNQNVGGF
jgi:hypothetical protein